MLTCYMAFQIKNKFTYVIQILITLPQASLDEHVLDRILDGLADAADIMDQDPLRQN